MLILWKTLEVGCLLLQRLSTHQSISKHHAGEDCDAIHQPPPTDPDNPPEKVCSGHLRVTRKNPKTLFKAWFDCRCGTKLRLHPITTIREPCWDCGPLHWTKTGNRFLLCWFCVFWVRSGCFQLEEFRNQSASRVVRRTIICCQSNRGTLAGTQLIIKR